MIAVNFCNRPRPDRKNGYAAPQLHTHVVVFNMTQCEDGKVAPCSRVSCTGRKLATAIYRARFAEKLQALGYEIRVDPRTGAPEIKGHRRIPEGQQPAPQRSLTEKKKDGRGA